MNPKLSTQLHNNPGPKSQQTYLLVVDYNSKFVFVDNLENSQSLSVINKCKKIFLQYGIPKEVISDKGLEFTSNHFKKFSKGWNFKKLHSKFLLHQSCLLKLKT